MIHGFFNYQKYIGDALLIREYIAENISQVLSTKKS